MSTRAVVGILNADGTVTAGWQWNDSMNLPPILKKYFKTEEDVRKLASYGMWNNLFSPIDRDYKYFKAICMEPGTHYYMKDVCKCHMLKESPNDSAKSFEGDEGIVVNADGSMTFESVDRAKKEDCNYVFLFHPCVNEWEKIRTY